MKTAVQELVDELLFIQSIKENEITESNKAILTTAAIKQAIEKEKKQIMNAVGLKKSTKKDIFGNNRIITLTPEEYYNQIYNQQEDKTFKQKSKWTEVDNMTRRLK